MTMTGSSDNKTAQKLDPFPTFKFYVVVGGIAGAAFTECSGLDMSTSVYEYEEGGANDFVHKFPGRTKYSNVTLKRGFTVDNELYKWYTDMQNALRSGQKFSYRQVTITMYGTVDQSQKGRWTLNDAFPFKWVGPSFKTDEAAVAIETLEFAHHGITFEKG